MIDLSLIHIFSRFRQVSPESIVLAGVAISAMFTLSLIHICVKEDGYTMPVVCYYVKSQDVYLIVDGFHRYQVMMDHPDIYEREQGLLPVSVIEKPLDKRMASTCLLYTSRCV